MIRNLGIDTEVDGTLNIYTHTTLQLCTPHQGSKWLIDNRYGLRPRLRLKNQIYLY